MQAKGLTPVQCHCIFNEKQTILVDLEVLLASEESLQKIKQTLIFSLYLGNRWRNLQ